MKEGKAKFENKGLVILLCVLVVVIVGLVVGVTFVNMTREDGGVDEGDFVISEELMGDDLSPEDQVIKETSLMMQDPDSSEEDVESYYDDVIEGAIDSGDTGFAAEITVQKMNFLAVVEDSCTKAKEYINNVDLSFYSAEERLYLASYAISMANGCGDSDLQARWESFYEEERNNS